MVPDLVEYVIVGVPDLDGLATVVPALAEMAGAGTIRILDLVAVARDPAGALTVLEFEVVPSLGALADVDGQVGRLLSERDIAMASLAVRPDSAAIIVVTEDRWAAPLSMAAGQAGGQILGGERVLPTRVESLLADPPDHHQQGGG